VGDDLRGQHVDLALACAFLGRPRAADLDEPSAHLGRWRAFFLGRHFSGGQAAF
jgi:ATPase subunit of ABC transporter with duplicated ATPase domains